jgi:hypothetical protein
MGANNFSKVFLIGEKRDRYGEIGIYDLADGSIYAVRCGISNSGREWCGIYTDKFEIVDSWSYSSATASAGITFSQNGNILNGVLKWVYGDSGVCTFKFTMIFC